MKYIFILFFALGFATGCGEDEPEFFIEEDLQDIFNTFAEEAASRGVVIDYESLNIMAQLRSIGVNARAGTAGFCRSSENGSREVVVDRNFWNSAGPLQQELVVYHELGHCVLGLGHTDDLDDRGNCTSIMHSTVNFCEESFNSMTRSDYLDELFSQ